MSDTGCGVREHGYVLKGSVPCRSGYLMFAPLDLPRRRTGKSRAVADSAEAESDQVFVESVSTRLPG